jgi:GDP-D-mannose dehydratase
VFNRESPRNGSTFVTRKITRGLARIQQDLDDCDHLSNLAFTPTSSLYQALHMIKRKPDCS